MFKQLLAAAAVAVTLSAGVAAAKQDTTPANEVSAPAPSEKTRYCIKSQPVTGTMLQAQQCKTLAQWKALGVDPTAKRR